MLQTKPSKIVVSRQEALYTRDITMHLTHAWGRPLKDGPRTYVRRQSRWAVRWHLTDGESGHCIKGLCGGDDVRACGFTRRKKAFEVLRAYRARWSRVPTAPRV